MSASFGQELRVDLEDRESRVAMRAAEENVPGGLRHGGAYDLWFALETLTLHSCLQQQTARACRSK